MAGNLSALPTCLLLLSLATAFVSADYYAPETTPTPSPPAYKAPSVPEPEYTALKPEYTVPKPEYTVPKPEYTVPKPEYTVPKPEYTVPKPEYTAPKPEYTAPKPEYTAPKPEYTAPKPEYSAPKPEYSAPKPEYTVPKPEYSAPKPEYSAPKPVYTAPKPEYTAPKPYDKPVTYKPPTVYPIPYVPNSDYKPPTAYYPHVPYVPKPKLPYVPKPDYKPPHVSEPEYTGPKPSYKPPTYKPAPYVPKPDYKPPTAHTPYVPYVSKPKLTIGIAGTILCKSGYHTYPIKGAKAKVVCPVVDLYGHEKAPVTYTSLPTDSKGYFLFTLYGLTDKVKNINACKVKLAGSPDYHCNVATNVNKGKTGAPLPYNHKFVPEKLFKLYTVGPFYYSGYSAPKPGY